MQKRLGFGAVLLLLCTLAAAQEEVRIGEFSAGKLDGWQEKSFAGHTQYQLQEAVQGKVLHARANASASGLLREIKVDLEKTPFLNWSWRVDNTFKDNDERSKAGDDYPARVYVVVSGGMLFWKTRAVNYVWSSHQPQGSDWPNAYTKNAHMLALQSGTAKLGRWVQEKRNVRDDLNVLFGKDVDHIDAIAIMVDADNTRQSASASFGDIWFSAN